MFDFAAFAQGMPLGLGMVICPDPKDVLGLRQVLRRASLLELLAIGLGSDALLIFAGMGGVAAALREAPALQRSAMWVGVALLLWYGGSALRRSRSNPDADMAGAVDRAAGGRGALLMIPFVNPVAWMDTVLVIGLAGALLPSGAQTSYGAGAVAASAIRSSHPHAVRATPQKD